MKDLRSKQLKEHEYQANSDEVNQDEKPKPQGKLAKLKQFFSNFSKFKKGVVLFQYEAADPESIDDETGGEQVSSNNQGKVKQLKNILFITVGIVLVLTAIKGYYERIGTEKEQSLTYESAVFLNYTAKDLPRLLNAHHFTFFDKKEVEDRVDCKIENNEQQCKLIEQRRCEYKGLSTVDYETCMISIYRLLNQNASSFCLSHYLNYDVFKDNLDPKYALYYQRKYSCLEATGIPKGREYCEAIRDHTEGWNTQNLFSCFRDNRVNYSLDYCRWKFNVTSAQGDQAKADMKTELVRCYGQKGVKMDMQICQSLYSALKDVISCYDGLTPTREICKAKYDYHLVEQDKMLTPARLWTKADLQTCYKGAGYTLDKQFCDTYFKTAGQMDARYECYDLIDLKDDDGKPMKKGRTYCELKNPDQYINKYNCIEDINCINKGFTTGSAEFLACKASFITKKSDFCQNVRGLTAGSPEDLKCQNEIKQDIKNLPKDKGADYCYLNYFWDDQYDLLYKCLEDQGLHKDSTYCKLQYKNLVDTKMKEAQKDAQGDLTQAQPTVQVDTKVFYDCIKKAEYGGIPDSSVEGFDSQQCSNLVEINKSDSFNQTKLTSNDLIVTKNQEADIPFKTEGHTCISAKGSKDNKAWIKSEFKSAKEETIFKIQVFNPSIKGSTSHLEDAIINVGDRVCTKVDGSPPINQVVTFECIDKEQSIVDADTFKATALNGVQGKFIKFESKYEGDFTICDLTFIALNTDQSQIQSLKDNYSKCLSYQQQCIAKYPDTELFENAENKFNCLERYGIKSSAEYCIQQHKAQLPQFFYPLGNRYLCLADPNSNGLVQLDEDATKCINLYYEYQVEQCLIEYEAKYGGGIFIGFKGNGEPGTDAYYSAYGNLTMSLADREAAIKSEILKQSAQQLIQNQVQVSFIATTKNLGPQGISDFLCSNSKMYFYSNPYNNKYIDPKAKQNHLKYQMECEAFFMGDQVVMHTYQGTEAKFEKGFTPDDIEDKKIADLLYINRTDLNEQYWRVEFHKDLEFMRINKTQMYIRLQDPQAKEVDSPVMGTNEASIKNYEAFRASNMTHKVYESFSQVIAVEEVQVTVLDARPQTDIYNEAPIANSKKILGIPIQVEDVTDRIIKVKSEYDTRLVSNMTDDDKGALLRKIQNGEINPKTVTLQHIGLRLTFIQKVFTYNFYSFKDFFGDIGGVFGAVKLSIGNSFGAWIILFFIVDLIYMIIAKHNYEYRVSTIKALSPKCQLYKDFITILKTENEGNEAKLKELEEDEQELERAMEQIDHSQIDKSNIMDTYNSDDSEDDQQQQKKPQKCVSQQEIAKLEEPQKKGGCPCFGKKKEKDMTKSELMQLLLERLEKLEKKYGHPNPMYDLKYETDILDQRGFVHKICSARKDLSFLGITSLMKQRVSFFGIYSLTENVDLTHAKVEYLKKQLNAITSQLIANQNLLLKYFKEQRKQNLDVINQKFEELADKEDFLNLKNEYDQTCQDHDGLIEDIQKELQSLKKDLNNNDRQPKEQSLTFSVSTPVESQNRLGKKIKNICSLLAQTNLSEKVEQFLKRIHESIISQDQEKMQSDLSMILSLIEAHDFDNLHNSIHRIVLKASENDQSKGLQKELSSLMDCLQNTKAKWTTFEKELHTLRQLQQKIYWNIMDYEMGAQTSIVEQRKLQFTLRQQQEAWNKVQQTIKQVNHKFMLNKQDLGSLIAQN